MGTSMAMIQNAYQGFAKQNYTMLDNLKLGYGGTQAEMYRLMKDAEALGAKFNSEFYLTEKGTLVADFADITTAIHVVQTEMGITGTTAKEASTTIEGSVNSAKAAWSNLVTGIANENADLNTLIGNFVQSAETAAGNIIPRLTQILSGMGSAIEQIAPVLSTQIPAIVTQVLPPMVSAGSQLLVGLINGLISATPQLLAAVPGIVQSVVQSIQGSGPILMQAGTDLLTMIQNGIVNGLPVLAESAATIMGNLGSYLQQNLPTLLQSGLSAVSTLTGSIRENAGVLIDGALALAQSLAQGLADSIPTIVENVPTIVSNIAGVINDNAPKIISAAANIMSTLAKGLISAIPTIVANLPQIINAIVDVFLAFNWINLGTSVIKGFANGIKSMVAFVKNSANGIGTAVKEGLASLPSEMVNIGKNIIQGLINGVKSLASAVKSNIKSVVGGAVSTVKNFLGIHSPSTVFYSIGEYIMHGLELGLQDSAWNVMETVENIVAELKKRFDTIANIYTTRQDISDLEYQLWEGSEGKSATEVEKYAKKLQLLTKQQNDQQNVVDAAVAAYQKIVEQYGDNTQESYEYQKTLLEEQLELQNLQNEIYDTVAAMQELSKAKSGMSSVSFGESGLGTATSATINATESVADREISASFTANLVTPDGSKLASWQLPYLIKAGSAAGTPIAEAQRA